MQAAIPTSRGSNCMPLAMRAVAAPVLVIMNCASPLKSAISVGASPTYGTCTAMFCGNPAW
jgi:hypothetical protein